MISILLPTKTRCDLIPSAYGSLLVQMRDCKEEYEIIVVNDNKSPSIMHNLLDKLGIRYVDGPCQGSAAAFQIAANLAKGDKLLFYNDDIFAYQPFINPMLKAYDQGYFVVGAKLLYENMTIQHAGMEFLPQHGWMSNHCFRFQSENLPEANVFKEMPCVTFSLTLVNERLFHNLEGFHPDFHGENYSDTDFCLRALEAGKKICYQPESAAIHYESATRGHNLDVNLKTFKTFQKKWVDTGRIQRLLKKREFIV